MRQVIEITASIRDAIRTLRRLNLRTLWLERAFFARRDPTEEQVTDFAARHRALCDERVAAHRAYHKEAERQIGKVEPGMLPLLPRRLPRAA